MQGKIFSFSTSKLQKLHCYTYYIVYLFNSNQNTEQFANAAAKMIF